MRKNGSGRAALAAIGAAAGTAFASGRALAGFYAQLGGLSWLAVCLSAAVFGMLTGLCAKHAARFGAGSFAELCRRGLSRGACRAVGLLHGLLMALTALTMLFWCARLGELSLPLHGSALCACAADARCPGWASCCWPPARRSTAAWPSIPGRRGWAFAARWC